MTTLRVIDMEKAISAADANRKFSQLLRDVREGQSFVVTSHGRPVARIAPVEEDRSSASSARDALLNRLRSERVVNIGRWTRDELYD
jgi:prevent-host-death family protein